MRATLAFNGLNTFLIEIKGNSDVQWVSVDGFVINYTSLFLFRTIPDDRIMNRGVLFLRFDGIIILG